MASYQYSYVMKSLTKTFPGGREILKGITLSFLPGAKIGVLGPNGAGKSTLMKIMAGMDTEFGGEAWAADGVRVGYLAQEPDLDPTLDAQGNIMMALGDTVKLLERFNEISARFAEPMEDDEMNDLLAEQGDMQERIDAVNGWEVERTLDIAMDALRCPPGDSDVTKLSGGERRRVALCRLLLERPDILMLDEPTNHLDAESVAWLETFLKDYEGTVMIVTHDRYFLDNITNWILEIDRGRGIPYEGNYSAWLEQKQKRLAQEEKEESARQKSLKHELEWIRSSPRARQAKSKARITAYDDLLAEAGDKRLDSAQIIIPPGERLGDLVVEAENLQKAFAEKLLIEDLSFKLPPGGIVGVIGPNGAGKTTLLNILTGATQPDHGTVRLGASVQMVTLDQMRESLDPKVTLSDTLTGGGGDMVSVAGKPRHVIGYMKDFLFAAEQAKTPIGELSGGERGRLMLARALASPSNLLVLDEPTNDLDLETLDLLQEMLADYQGAVMLVSHDRDFIDRVVTSVIAWEGDGRWVEYAGGYSDIQAQRRQNAAEEKKATDKTAVTSPSTSSPPSSKHKGKLSFNEAHALKTLPGKMAKLEREIESHHKTLADPNLYARDPQAFDNAAGVLKAAETSLAAMEEEWLALELEKEEIEGGEGK